MKHFLLALVLTTGSFMALDNKGTITGFITDTPSTIDFFDQKNMPTGWYDKTTDTLYDKYNRPTLNIKRLDK